MSLIESELPAGDAFAIACVWVGCAAHELCGELCVALGRSAVQQRPPVVHAAALGRVHLDDASVNLLEELSAHVVGRERVRVGHGECVLGVCVCRESFRLLRTTNGYQLARVRTGRVARVRVAAGWAVYSMYV